MFQNFRKKRKIFISRSVNFYILRNVVEICGLNQDSHVENIYIYLVVLFKRKILFLMQFIYGISSTRSHWWPWSLRFPRHQLGAVLRDSSDVTFRKYNSVCKKTVLRFKIDTNNNYSRNVIIMLHALHK